MVAHGDGDTTVTSRGPILSSPQTTLCFRRHVRFGPLLWRLLLLLRWRWLHEPRWCWWCFELATSAAVVIDSSQEQRRRRITAAISTLVPNNGIYATKKAKGRENIEHMQRQKHPANNGLKRTAGQYERVGQSVSSEGCRACYMFLLLHSALT